MWWRRNRSLGKEGLLRQASLKTLREDKSAGDLQRDPDQPAVVKKTGKSAARKVAAAKVKRSKKNTKTSNHKSGADGSGSHRTDIDLSYISHPERIVFPSDDYTKQQVAEYYERVMPWLLPQIAGRPLSIVRCPDGAKQACFFQKHHSAQIGLHVRALPMRDSSGAKVNFLYVDDAEGVRNLVQMNVLEFHPWGTTIDNLDSTDLMMFDLDPGPRVIWQEVIAVATRVRTFLSNLGLQSFVKLSGGKGLHVAVPLDPPQPWTVAKPFCRQVAAALTQERPHEFIDVAAKSKRLGRIFVDYLRNSRGATSVAAYSLRARPGAPVAMPIEWTQLKKIPAPNVFTLDSTPSYLDKRKNDPWRTLHETSQTLDLSIGDDDDK